MSKNHNYKPHVKKIVTICYLVILIMVTAAVVLAHNNEMLKPSIQKDKWQIDFTSIAEGEKIGNAVSRHKPEYSSTKASFFVDFVAPGDSITYELQISNLGNIDAVLSDIVYITSPNKEAIKYEIIDFEKGDRLDAGKSKNFKVKISYELTAEEAVKYNKPISIVFDFRQAY